jgi:hypothetical protein
VIGDRISYHNIVTKRICPGSEICSHSRSLPRKYEKRQDQARQSLKKENEILSKNKTEIYLFIPART